MLLNIVLDILLIFCHCSKRIIFEISRKRKSLTGKDEPNPTHVKRLS